VDSLWPVLTQFIFRVTLGVAVAMAVTPAALVTSGFYRVHLWVLLGLNTVAALAVFTTFKDAQLLLAVTVAIAAASYIGAVIWMYEQRVLGVIALRVIAALALAAALMAASGIWQRPVMAGAAALDIISAGLVMGATLTAMFLGHWYLNTPTMQLAPLQRLVLMMIAAVVLRACVSGGGAVLYVLDAGSPSLNWWAFLALRWIAGLLSVAGLAVMAWQTLKIPNTQSATGILYAAVILVFIGELTAQLLSAGTLFVL